MVTRKHTKSAKKREPQQSAAHTQNPPLTIEQKAAKFDELMASYGEAIKSSDAVRRANEAAAEALMAERQKPTELSPDHVQLITCAMNQINLSAVAMNQLAIAAADSDESESQWYLVAVQDAAKLTARRCDYVMELLTGHTEFGNFLEQLEAEAGLRDMTWRRERGAAQ